MDDFFDDLDADLMMAQMEDMKLDQQPIIPPNLADVDGPGEEAQGPDNSEESEHRTIERIGNFDVTSDPENEKHRLLDDGTIRIMETIGKGGFCKVKEADVRVFRELVKKSTGERVEVNGMQHLAVKVFNRNVLKGQKTSEYDPFTGCLKMSDQLQSIMEEIKVWERSSNPNIVKIFKLFNDPTVPEMYLLMERAKYGQIQNDIEGGEHLTERNAEIEGIAASKADINWPGGTGNSLEKATKWIFFQVASAMNYLHNDLKIAHRDLKHQNILMGLKSPDPLCEDERQPMIKVCDFTTALFLKDDSTKVVTQAGTLPFNAPEQFLESEFLPKPLDVWAYGISLFVYLTNDLPYRDLEKAGEQLVDHGAFAGIMPKIDFAEIVQAKLSALGCSASLITLLQKILSKDPGARPTFEDILADPWFVGRVEEQLSTEEDVFAPE